MLCFIILMLWVDGNDQVEYRNVQHEKLWQRICCYYFYCLVDHSSFYLLPECSGCYQLCQPIQCWEIVTWPLAPPNQNVKCYPPGAGLAGIGYSVHCARTEGETRYCCSCKDHFASACGGATTTDSSPQSAVPSRVPLACKICHRCAKMLYKKKTKKKNMNRDTCLRRMKGTNRSIINVEYQASFSSFRDKACRERRWAPMHITTSA